MPISRANGVDIYYERAGSGPPMLFLHAMPFDHSLWMYQVARYSARYTTIALVFPVSTCVPDLRL